MVVKKHAFVALPPAAMVSRTAQIGREVLDAAGRAVRAGATTDEIDRVVSPCMYPPSHTPLRR